MVVDNGVLRVVLHPALGAKISSIAYLPLGEELLWRNPHVPLRAAPPGSVYDDCWSGGWDELFPNDEPASVAGRQFPDHGELWTAPWTAGWTVDAAAHRDHIAIHLETHAPAAGATVRKRIEIREGEACIHFHHSLRNLVARPLPFLWKLHPAFAVQAGDRIEIPATTVRCEPKSPGTLSPHGMVSPWPHIATANGAVDARAVLPAGARALHFYYALGLRDGWCAIHRPARQLAFGLAFPREIFTSCWVFASYGGWNGYQVAVLEPATSHPFRLEDAIAEGTCSILPPLGELQADVVFAVRSGIGGVSGITPAGAVEA